ncbi:transcription repressor OFP13-like [Panicum virgatum]|uniref:Transcription repressor n=1 Tax=Panicum virgatum TaxID=38727 RepID=A0A8T0P4E9_PANVG|nr:transcription repressor OFP13-like [Panicum virgatum]KAG2555878.1 hypothetical protein PVAP13_8NG082900 [Panicum virgatum]
MGRKGGLASIFSSKPKPDDSPSAPWPWPSCAANPQTASFRGPGRRRHADDDRPCTTGSSDPAAGRLRPPRKAAACGDEMYKTVNSVYFDDAADSCSFFFDDDGAWDAAVDDLDLDDGSFSTTTASEEWSEAVIRSLGRTSTDRFFFDVGPAAPASNSILAASPSHGSRTTARALAPPAPEAPAKQQLLASAAAPAPSDDDQGADSDSEEDEPPPPQSTSLVESVAVALDSEDPFRDFRASMADMVAAHGLRDWAQLQEMLLWYLRINGKHNHALIVGAFVDLLVGFAASSGACACASHSHTTTATMTTTTTTTTSACSTSTTSSSSSASSGDGDVTAAATSTPLWEQCGVGNAGASSDLEEEEDEKANKC